MSGRTRQPSVQVVVCLNSPCVLEHWRALIGSSESTRIAAPQQLILDYVASLEEAEERLVRLFERQSDSSAILISDALLEPDEDWHPAWRQTSAVKELCRRFASNPFVSLAVCANTCRVPDVDLVLPETCTADMWLSGLDLLLQRLSYFKKPVKQHRRVRVDVRRIFNRTDLAAALRLRFNVYRVMGYLDDALLATRSEMELNWCDFNALHFGAFARLAGGREELVGTARLIMSSGADCATAQSAKAIAEAQPQLSRLIAAQRTQMALFRLPIFHTLNLNRELRDTGYSSCVFGELSRVVVAPEWRGHGLSSRLIELAVAEADRRGIRRLFLECLSMHKGMYEKLGFTVLGQYGEVLGVGKTMIGMKRDMPAVLATR